MMDESNDPFDLKRFLDAQRGSYEPALAELRAGRKETHWSWYIFPQVLGLGSSAMSTRYAIRSLAEARAYLKHPVLGARLRECISALNAHAGLSADQILGEVEEAMRRRLRFWQGRREREREFGNSRDGVRSSAPGETVTAYITTAPKR